MRNYVEGDYLATIEKVELGESKNGTPQVVFTVRPYQCVSKPDFAVPEYDRRIYRPITDKSVEYVVKDLIALGYDRNDFSGIEDGSFGADIFGKEVKLRLKYEDYQGTEQERWSLLLGNGGEVKKLDASSVKKLNAVFGSAFKAARGGSAPAPSRPAASNGATPRRPAPASAPVNSDGDEVF